MISERRYREIAGVFIFLAGLLLLLSLCTYSSSDLEMLRINKPVQNLIGPMGAWIGNMGRIALGYPSVVLCCILFLYGWHLIKGGETAALLEKIFALSYCMITISALFALVESKALPQDAGGFLGLYLYRFFHSIAGKVGAVLVISILNLIGLILLGVFSVISLVHAAGERKPLTAIKQFLARFKTRRKSGAMPLNTLSDTLQKKSGKPPWIEKKRVSVYHGQILSSSGDYVPEESRYLLEYRNPFAEVNQVPEDETALSFHDEENFELAAPEYPIDDHDNKAQLMTDEDNESINDPGGLLGTEGTAVAEALEDLLGNNRININRLRFAEDTTGGDHRTELNDTAGSMIDSINTGTGMLTSSDSISGKSTKEKERTNIKTGSDIQQTFEFGIPELDEPTVGEKIFDEITINRDYIIPTAFLQSTIDGDTDSWKSEIIKNSELLVNTLKEFSIESKITNVNRGPVITLYEMQIAPGIKVNRIVGLADDIAMALSGSRVRIVAPIPGKSAIGVEVPNRKREMVTLGDIINSKEYEDQPGYLKVALGKDILGKPIMLDLKKLPHLLIAGATGSGKSVCVNSIITSLVYNYDPNYVRFILVDPKMVELQLYNGIPHLLTPVITEAHIAPKALKWAMFEMERRYRLLSELHTRDIERYNKKIHGYGDRFEHLPYIVIIMDEMADLMMVASKEIEGFVTRIAQKARAVGIHLVLATQRPSVDVITGVIKANFPARIAFQVAQKTDSRTIIDQNGAEKLLGKGDMLYQSPLSSFPVRIQGTYISEDEVMSIVQHLRKLGNPSYIDIDEAIFEEDIEDDEGSEDELFVEALKIVEETKKASASYLQRRLSIGYNRAARIIELMEERGYIGPQQGSKPREVFI